MKTFYNDHICPRKSKNRAANRKWLAGKLVKKLRKYLNLKHGEAATYFKRRCDLDLNKSSLTRALTDARNVVYGDVAAQYLRLRDYAETLLKSNPGSTIKIGVSPQLDSDPIFEKIYVCLDGCKKGFKAGCRPLIGLDGAFLKTQFGGQILSAVGQDANNHVYIIAWAIVEIENKENWRWFLELLVDDVGEPNHGWCIMSDMQKGLIPAVREVMPMAHHRFCVWHLWRNFNKKWKESELRGLLWECARKTTRHGFQQKLERIRNRSEEAWAYFDKWPKESWTKAFFRHDPKIDNITNNACEVFNSRIKEYRAKPIITLLEEVRMFAMRSIAKNKVKLANYIGMPCVHACAALSRVNKDPEDFCHKWLTMDSYKATYLHSLNPIPGEALWEKSVYLKPLAPKVKRKPETLTKKEEKMLMRNLQEFTCTYCGTKGHTKRSCSHRKTDDEAIAEATAAAEAAAVANTGEAAAVANTGDAVDVGADGHNGNTASNDGHVANDIGNDADNNANNDTAASEVEITQPSYSQPLINEVVAPLVPIQPTRPNKLPPKRRSQHSTAANMDPM
ncbi:uncharacterized protein [Arachis hypogaea]|uniref:uncharacterized protein n=1 Tax=Arachis hypogaea TaxID=3818 RepID=UPI003B213DB4